MISTNLRYTEDELFHRIVASAKKNKRSMNSEVLWAIQYYLEHSPEAKKQEQPKEKPAPPK